MKKKFSSSFIHARVFNGSSLESDNIHEYRLLNFMKAGMSSNCLYRLFFVSLICCIVFLFSACTDKSLSPSTEGKKDNTEYSAVLALDKSFFTDIKKGDLITIKTRKCGILKKPDAEIGKPKIKLMLNDSDASVLTGGKFSENAVFDKAYKNAGLLKAEQTTSYTVNAKEAAGLKENGLVVLGYGAEVSGIKLSCIDYSSITGSGIDTKSSSKTYFQEHFHSGWNMGNYLDTIASGRNKGFSAAENWCKAEASPELFKGLRALGFDFVRIPVTYLNHLGDGPEYKINEDWLSYVKNVVDMALAENLGVIINIHHDGSDVNQWLNISKADDNIENYRAQTIQFCQIWSQIAEAFKDYGSNLAFEGFNEIQDGKWGWGDNRNDDGIQYSIVNKWNQAFTAVVRASGGNNSYRYLGFNGYCASPDYLSYLKLPEDIGLDDVNRLAVSFHYYSPYEFGIEASLHKWGSDFGNVTQSETSKNDQEKALMKCFDRVSALFKDSPVYVGEYGATYQGDLYSDYQRYYLEFLVRYARQKNMMFFIWDNNAESVGRESFGYINRKTGKVRPGYEKIIEAVNRAAYSDSDYSIELPEERP